MKAVTILADLKDPEVGERIVRETLEGLGGREIHILGEWFNPWLLGRVLSGLWLGYEMLRC